MYVFMYVSIYVYAHIHTHINTYNFMCRIWDKVIAGSCVVLVFVCVALLQSVRDAILNMKSINDIVTAVCKV